MMPFTLWSVNKRKLLIRFIIQEAIVCGMTLGIMHDDKFKPAAWLVIFSGLTCLMSLITFLVFIIPLINAFRVIKRLVNDNAETSILPLFDTGYTIEQLRENSWIFFTIPCIKATIRDIPVSVSFNSSSRSSWSNIGFYFSPLSKENSKRIYGKSIYFTMYLTKRLKKDVKPQVLALVETIKKEGFTSGANRPISTVHVEAYAE